MTKTISVNGKERAVVTSLSSGPGTEAHSYQIKGGAWVCRYGFNWFIEEPGQFKRQVEVAL